MPSLIPGERSKPGSKARPMRIRMSRQAVIEIGLNALNELGSDNICKVCIKYGGSCCIGCLHLVNGTGCTLRNTSCTAWLCGNLKYLLYATGQLEEWNAFWRQVPGQSHREDDTPEYFTVEKPLHLQSIRKLGEALAADLQELATKHKAAGFISELRDKIDKNIDQLNHCKNDPKRRTRVEKNIKALTSPFHRLQLELQEYRLRIGESE
ncbi:hypothetical protein PCCS19_35200 [Paenibacillus sp. CCS19]|uniref:hypothetical protein n=1 Tax=Paenibacillus sp. CCS19 TaxID=3158387 RepID=UPI0025676F37|nr:hypothetical protein [Paenibacillus cellulosilyticus]GMK40464.1 hypothetical protein PCCS19_35200 [Paenibacillus cellulosilyticus]